MGCMSILGKGAIIHRWRGERMGWGVNRHFTPVNSGFSFNFMRSHFYQMRKFKQAITKFMLNTLNALNNLSPESCFVLLSNQTVL